jgi:hypothetical protein
LGALGFVAGEKIRAARRRPGFDANNDDYTVQSVSANQIVLTQTGAWTTTGAPAQAVSLSEFVPVEGQRIRIGGSAGNDGDYRIKSISGDGKTVVLTATTGTPWAWPDADQVVLSGLAENTITGSIAARRPIRTASRASSSTATSRASRKAGWPKASSKACGCASPTVSISTSRPRSS